MVVDGAREAQHALAQQPAVDVERALAAGGLLNHNGDHEGALLRGGCGARRGAQAGAQHFYA